MSVQHESMTMEQPGLGCELLKTEASSGWRVAPPDVRVCPQSHPLPGPFFLPQSFVYGRDVYTYAHICYHIHVTMNAVTGIVHIRLLIIDSYDRIHRMRGKGNGQPSSTGNLHVWSGVRQVPRASL